MSQPLRVAILDENLMFTATVQGALRRQGYQAEVFPPAESGFRRLAEFQPRVALVSLAAPGPDPGAWVRRLKTLPELVDVILVAYTGHLEADRVRAGRAAGADRVVANSAVMGDAAAVVRQALAGR